MKSERRHELQRNALAEWMITTWENVKPYVNSILIGVIVLLLAVLGYRWLSGRSAGQEARAWNDVFFAMNTGNTAELERVADAYQGTTAADWALVLAGDLSLQAGCEELFRNKATAGSELDSAVKKYDLALRTSREDGLRERATFGLARAYEAMAGVPPKPKKDGSFPTEKDCRKNSLEMLDLAIKNYETVANDWSEGAYAADAAQRAASLEQLNTKEFYRSFALWDPKPAFSSPEGMDGINLPFDDSSLKEGSDPEDFFESTLERLDAATGGGAEDGEAAAETPVEEVEMSPPIELEIPEATPGPEETPAAEEKSDTTGEPSSTEEKSSTSEKAEQDESNESVELKIPEASTGAAEKPAAKEERSSKEKPSEASESSSSEKPSSKAKPAASEAASSGDGEGSP